MTSCFDLFSDCSAHDVPVDTQRGCAEMFTHKMSTPVMSTVPKRT